MTTTDTGRAYKARPGSRLSDADAELIGTFVESEFDGNVVHPSDLVHAAWPATSPIHHYFEWDDTEAARLYRIRHARDLLGSIHFVVLTAEGEEIQSRAFHNVTVITEEGADRGYVSSDVVWRQPDLAAQVIEKAKRELTAWAERYRVYEELSAPVAHIVAEVIPMMEEGS